MMLLMLNRRSPQDPPASRLYPDCGLLETQTGASQAEMESHEYNEKQIRLIQTNLSLVYTVFFSAFFFF